MLKQIKNFLIMTLSITIMAIGVYYFKFPNNFTFGGVTGAAVVFAKITPLSASMLSSWYSKNLTRSLILSQTSQCLS